MFGIYKTDKSKIKTLSKPSELSDIAYNTRGEISIKRKWNILKLQKFKCFRCDYYLKGTVPRYLLVKYPEHKPSRKLRVILCSSCYPKMFRKSKNS